MPTPKTRGDLDRMAAAAPDLLAALVDLLEAYDDGEPRCFCARSGHPSPASCVECRARDAIARAEGRVP